MSFNKNIFINCPFDSDYHPLLKSLIFTILYFKFEPQISITKSSGKPRIAEIIELIKGSKYSIHDISRCEPGDLPRFNMPYEMGLDLGCFNFGNAQQRSKKCLILEKVKNRYDIVISDISGQDIEEHNNSPRKLIGKVMKWLFDTGAIKSSERIGLTAIWSKYLDCNAKIEVTLTSSGFTKKEIKNLAISQYIEVMKEVL